MESFSKIIQDAGYISTIRRSRGQDILGACGQLRTESERDRQREQCDQVGRFSQVLAATSCLTKVAQIFW